MIFFSTVNLEYNKSKTNKIISKPPVQCHESMGSNIVCKLDSFLFEFDHELPVEEGAHLHRLLGGGVKAVRLETTSADLNRAGCCGFMLSNILP